MKVREVIKLVEQDGWVHVETHGSHRPGKEGPCHDSWSSSEGHAARDTEKYFQAGGIEMKHAVIYEKSSNGYGAYVPDLPGCVAVGDTLDETQRLIKEAIELHLKGMREDGEPIPQPTSIAENVSVLAGD